MADALEDILGKSEIDFAVIAELAKGLSGDETYRKKYEIAYAGIEFDASFAKYHVETPINRPKNIRGVDKTLNGHMTVKKKGLISTTVIDANYYLPGEEKWSFNKVDNKDLYVQTLCKVIKQYEASLK